MKKTEDNKFFGIIVERHILSDDKLVYIYDSIESGIPVKNQNGDILFKTDGGDAFYFAKDYKHCFTENDFFCIGYDREDKFVDFFKEQYDLEFNNDDSLLDFISDNMYDAIYVGHVLHEKSDINLEMIDLSQKQEEKKQAHEDLDSALDRKPLLPSVVNNVDDSAKVKKDGIKNLIQADLVNIDECHDYNKLLEIKKEVEKDYHDRNVVNAYIKYKKGNSSILPYFEEEFINSKRVGGLIDALRSKKINREDLDDYYEANSNIIDQLDDYLKQIDYKTINGIDTIEKRKIEEKELEYIFTTILNVKNSHQIFDEMTKTIISQDDAIKRIITEINRFSLLEDKSNKKGILLTGSTGVGKTLIIKTLAKLLNKPVCIIDSSQLVINGYRGTHIDEYLETCLASLDYDVEKLENSIIYFDEIDKKGMENDSDVSGKGVLDSLLKFLDGTTYNIQVSEGLTLKTYQVKTDNMLVIAGGSFDKVYGREPHRAAGFLADLNPKLEIKDEDFMTYGNMTKEFMGRFPIVIHLNDLKEKDYKKILLESDISPLKIERDTFAKIGVNLDTSEAFLDEVSKQAIDSGKGARGLSGIISNCTSEAFSYATDNIGKVDNIKLTKRTAEDNAKFTVGKAKTKVKNLH